MKDLAYWLRKSPQPKAVLADERRIEVPNNGRSWRDLTQTIQALEPSKLTCLDGSGNVIRSITLETDEDKGAAPSPEMADLQLFAKLLAEGYDKASSKMQPIVDSAMAFVERGGQRLAKAEAEIDRLRAIIHRQHQQIVELTAAPSGDGDDGGIMGAMLAGAAQKVLLQQQEPQPPTVTPIKQGAKK